MKKKHIEMQHNTKKGAQYTLSLKRDPPANMLEYLIHNQNADIRSVAYSAVQKLMFHLQEVINYSSMQN